MFLLGKKRNSGTKNTLRKTLRECHQNQDGWTYVETLVVIGIILLLTASVGITAFRAFARAQTASAKGQIKAFCTALETYAMDMKSYPTEEQGLEVLWTKPSESEEGGTWNGPYVDGNKFKDPWGSKYQYKVPGPNNMPFEIISLGSDKKVGGEGDAKDLSSVETQ